MRAPIGEMTLAPAAAAGPEAHPGAVRPDVRGQPRGAAPTGGRCRRCGPLSAEQESVIRSLPLERLEALLDFEGISDLHAWLAANT